MHITKSNGDILKILALFPKQEIWLVSEKLLFNQSAWSGT